MADNKSTFESVTAPLKWQRDFLRMLDAKPDKVITKNELLSGLIADWQSKPERGGLAALESTIQQAMQDAPNGQTRSWLRRTLESSMGGVMAMLRNNQEQLPFAERELSNTHRAQAAESRAARAETAEQKQTIQALVDTMPANLRPLIAQVMSGKDAQGNPDSAKRLQPSDLRQIQETPNLSAATKNLFAQGASFGDIRRQMLTDLVTTLPTDVKPLPVCATPQVATSAIPPEYQERIDEAVKVMTKRGKSAAEIKEATDSMRQLWQAHQTATAGAVAQMCTQLTPEVMRQAASQLLQEAPASILAPHEQARTNVSGLTREQQQAVIAMRKEIGQFKVATDVRLMGDDGRDFMDLLHAVRNARIDEAEKNRGQKR